MRSVDRSVEEVLLPAIELAYEREGRDAERELGSRWATGWLHAARRVVPLASRPQGVLLFDSSPRLDLESLHVQALELGLRRAGFRTLLLAFDLPPERVVRAIRALDPTAFVFCGGEATLEVVGRLVYTVRQVGSAGPVFEYREAMPVTGEHGIPSLGTVPSEAVERLKAYVDSGRLEQVVVAPEVEPPRGPAGSRAPTRARAQPPSRLLPQARPAVRRAPSIAAGCRPSSSAIRSPIAPFRLSSAPRPRCAAGSLPSWSARACPPPASPRSWCSPPPGARSSCARCGAASRWSKANATEVTETLEARGYVERRRLPADRRAVEVLLTPSRPRARGAGLPRARRAREPGVRRARRRREALARRDLPEAGGLSSSRSRPRRPSVRSGPPRSWRSSS